MKLSLRARMTLWYTIPLLVVLFLFGLSVLRLEGQLGLPTDKDFLTTTPIWVSYLSYFLTKSE